MDADRAVDASLVRTRQWLNMQAFLMLIRKCEGTDLPDGYRALFGYHPVRNPNHLFDSFAQHPNVRQPFTYTKNGVKMHDITTAAGAYQFIFPTWSRIALILRLSDFGPENQDRGAIGLIQQTGMVPVIERGDVRMAMDNLHGIWASLPGSKSGQPQRSVDYACNAYCDAGGVLA